MQKRANFFTKEEKDFVKKNINKYSYEEFSKILGRSRKSVVCHIATTGKYNTRDHWNLFNLNPEYFFNPISSEIAYVLGFLWADGCVKEKTSVISFDNIEEDFEDIISTLSKPGEWSIGKPKARKGKPQVLIETVNPPICDFLIEHDYGKKAIKSPYKILEKIPEENHYLFIRGWFDGDGSITKSGWCTSISSDFRQDWGALEKILKENLIRYSIQRFEHKPREDKKKYRQSMLEMYNSSSQIRFLDYIYKNREIDKIGLKRKWISYQNLLKKVKKGFPKVGLKGYRRLILGNSHLEYLKMAS